MQLAVSMFAIFDDRAETVRLTLFRLPDVVVGGLRFDRDSSIFNLSFLFVSYLSSSPNETQPKPAICSEVSAIWKSMSRIRGIPSPNNRGP